MDLGVRHWGGYARRFPAALPVSTIGYIPRKDHRVARGFEVCAFSLILSGRGDYLRAGRRWEVAAPCVFTQAPGEFLDYGPRAGETWEELYLVYEAGLHGRLTGCRLLDPERPVWAVHDEEAVRALVVELTELSRAGAPELAVDRVDRVCERLVLETWMTKPALDAEEAAMSRVLAEVRKRFSEEIDFEALAERHGMSESTFRRRWGEVVPQPPARYLQELRIREACRMLVETQRPIHEIAGAVGFDDELYFSRRFRQEMGVAPREYRKTHQVGRR